jgi:hypothetical protein
LYVGFVTYNQMEQCPANYQMFQTSKIKPEIIYRGIGNPPT